MEIKINKFRIYWQKGPDGQTTNDKNCMCAEITAFTSSQALFEWQAWLNVNRSASNYHRNSKYIAVRY